MATSLASPAASVADTGAVSGGAPSPSADLDNSLGTPLGGEPGGGAAAEPGAGATPDGGQPEAGAEATKGTADEGLDADGRAVPAKWREAFKNDPELKALFFERRAFQKEFPGGIQEVRALKSTLETVGGEAGLAEMQTNLADFRTLANQFLDGDPAYIEDVFETDPVAAVSHLPAYLDKAREADEPSYNREIAKRLYGELTAGIVKTPQGPAALRPALKMAYEAIREKDPQNPALGILNAIANWNDQLKAISEQEDDPRVKKLQDQIKEGRKSEETARLQQLENNYRTEVFKQIDATAEKLIASFTKGQQYDKDDMRRILKIVKDESAEAINADKAWIKKRDEVNKRQNMKASIAFVHARWEKEMQIKVPLIARTFIKGAKPRGAEPPKAGNGQPARPDATGFVKVAAPPDAKLVDQSRTTPDMITKQHSAILKDGKKVTWALAG